jgi:hypothetical protein
VELLARIVGAAAPCLFLALACTQAPDRPALMTAPADAALTGDDPGDAPARDAAVMATMDARLPGRPPRGGSGGGGGGTGGSAGRDGSSTIDAGRDSQSLARDAAASTDTNYNTPLVCSSGDHWMGGNRGAAAMYPGRACIACHTMMKGPAFGAAGTIFPSAHEPDDCNGADGLFTGAAIIIIDANGVEHPTSANLAGNFDFPTNSNTIPLPIRAKIVWNGRERVMITPQMSGDCNACHTVNGDKGAPGRVMLP